MSSIKLGGIGTFWTIRTFWLKLFELCKGAKRPQYNFSFMNKTGGRSNTAFCNLDL